MFNVKQARENNVVKVHLDGHLDSTTAPAFESKLAELLKDEGDFHIVMDCGELMFISSAGLRVFLTFAKKVKKQNGQMALSGLQPTVYAILEASGFLNFLTLCSTIEEAVAYVNNQGA